MFDCCICHFVVKNGRNISEEIVGESSGITLSDLIATCTKKTRYKIFGSHICKKCIGKCIKYYKATQIAKQLKMELLQLIAESAKAQPNKDNNDNLNEYGKKYIPAEFTQTAEEYEENESEIGVSKAELIKLEYEMEDYVDALEMEVADDVPSVTEISVQRNEMILTKFDYSDEEIKSVEKRFKQKDKSCKIKLKEQTKHECLECDEMFHTQRKYHAHMRKKHSTGFICDQCGKVLQSYSGFASHKQRHNPVKPFECNVCGERYHLKTSLKRHMAWHTGEKPFQCETCSKRFVHRVALYKHMQIHDDQTRRIECEVCGYKFRTKPHLTRHMATHTGAKPFSCPICGKCFSQVYNMKVHLKEHKNPGSTRRLRRFKCSKCAQIFTTKHSYEDHCQSNCESL